MAGGEDREAKRIRLAAEKQRGKRPAAATRSESVNQSHMDTSVEWPRLVPFPLPPVLADKDPHSFYNSDDYKKRLFTEQWDEVDSLFYNGLLNLNFKPTRMLDGLFFEKIKWLEHFHTLSDSLGLGTMLFQPYPFYPDIARQFLASCRVCFADERNKVAREGSLRFKIDGIAYSLSFAQICGAYGFDPSGEELQIPVQDDAIKALWREIAQKDYDSSRSVHTQIRHPVLRMFMKLVCNTLLCKMEPGKMRRTELSLLHYTIGQHFQYGLEMDYRHRINFGSVFAHHLEELKERGMTRKSTKEEFVGSLLTPLLRLVPIDFRGREKKLKVQTIGEDTMTKGNSLKVLMGRYAYSFLGDEGTMWALVLPSELCRVDHDEALRFEPGPGDVQKVSRLNRRARAPDSPPPGPSSAPTAATARHSTSSVPTGFDMGAFYDISDIDMDDNKKNRRFVRHTLKGLWKGLSHLLGCSSRDDVMHHWDSAPLPPPAEDDAGEHVSDSEPDA